MRTALFCALVLAGCSRPPAPPTPTATATASPATTIPAVLHGRYALKPADCEPPKGDVRGLLTIGDDAIAFGVTPVTVDRIALLPGRVLFDTTETQAGVAASRRYVFRTSSDHRRLTRVVPGRPDQVYTRCAIQPS